MSSLTAVEIFNVLTDKLSLEGALIPKYIGSFPNVESLPKGRYPHVYFWKNTTEKMFVLSFDDVALVDVCAEQSIIRGDKPDPKIIADAFVLFVEFSTRAFADLTDEIRSALCHDLWDVRNAT